MPATGRRTSSSLMVGSPWSKRSRPAGDVAAALVAVAVAAPAPAAAALEVVVVLVVRVAARPAVVPVVRTAAPVVVPVAAVGTTVAVAVATVAGTALAAAARRGRCRRGRRRRGRSPVAGGRRRGRRRCGRRRHGRCGRCGCGRRAHGCAAGGRPRCAARPRTGCSALGRCADGGCAAGVASRGAVPLCGRGAGRPARAAAGADEGRSRALGATGRSWPGSVTGPPSAPPLIGASRGAAVAATPPETGRSERRFTGRSFDEPLPLAEAPTWRSEMAATRSPLRILPVPEMPSSAARRCSSGSSIPDRPLPRRRGLPAVPEAAGASLGPGASCAPVVARSVVSLTYRSFPAVTCAYQRRGCPVPVVSRPGGGGATGSGWRICEADQRRRGDRLLRPRARLARVGGYAVSLDAAHGLDNTGGYRRVPRYVDDTCSHRPGHRRPVRIDLQREHRPPRRGEVADLAHAHGAAVTPVLRRAAGSARARWVRRRRRRRHARRRATGRSAPSDSGIAAVRCRWCSRSSVASSSIPGSPVSACTSSAARPALKAASACGTRSGSRRAGRVRGERALRHQHHRQDLRGDRQPVGERPRSASVQLSVAPPNRQAATLSGCPSSSVTSRRTASQSTASTSGHSDQAPHHPGDDGRGRGAHPPPLRDPVRPRPPAARTASSRARRRRRGTRGRRGASRRWAGRPRPLPAPRRTVPTGATANSTTSWQVRARPAQSKAGPRLALVAGTRTLATVRDRTLTRPRAPAAPRPRRRRPGWSPAPARPRWPSPGP